jgi:hypothetical protein
LEAEVNTQPEGLLGETEQDRDRRAAGRAETGNYIMLSVCIGSLVGGVVVGMVVGWACGRATMAAKCDELERTYQAYYAYKNNLEQQRRS